MTHARFRLILDQVGVHLIGDQHEVESIDIYFDAHRVWSISTGQIGATKTVAWPSAMTPYLIGHTQASIRDSENGKVLYEASLRFTDDDNKVSIVDRDGNPLAVNKWLRLAPILAESAVGVDKRALLLKMLIQAVQFLEEKKFQVFAVGGTALGLVRDGELLPFDDDGDLAVYFGEMHPIDVSRNMQKAERVLIKAGYSIRRHSLAHLQVYPNGGESSGLYFDLFAAFHHQLLMNQPFLIRGVLDAEDLVPFSRYQTEHGTIPLARNPEAWLTLNYGASWSTPQPGWRAKVPVSTKRYFNAWFGSFNLHRHYWELQATHEGIRNRYRLRNNRVVSDQPRFSSKSIVNFGCGVNPFPPQDILLTHEDAKIYAVDYADAMRDAARLNVPASARQRVQVLNVNANDYRNLLEFVDDLPPGAFDVYLGFFPANMRDTSRDIGIWRFVKLGILSGGTALMDYLVQPANPFDLHRAEDWHLEFEDVEFELKKVGLSQKVVSRFEISVESELRSGIRVELVNDDQRTGKNCKS